MNTGSGLGFAVGTATGMIRAMAGVYDLLQEIVCHTPTKGVDQVLAHRMRSKLLLELAQTYHAPLKIAVFLASCHFDGITLDDYIGWISSLDERLITQAIDRNRKPERLAISLE